MIYLRNQPKQMVRNEISTAFGQMSLRVEFHQHLLHLESALHVVYNRYDSAKDAHTQAVYDLSLIGVTKPKEQAATQSEVD